MNGWRHVDPGAGVGHMQALGSGSGGMAIAGFFLLL